MIGPVRLRRLAPVLALAALLCPWHADAGDPPPPAASAAASTSELTGLAGKPVAGVSVDAPPGYDSRELSRFLEVRPGDALSLRRVRRTIEVLAKLGEFSSIDAIATETGAGVMLRFRLIAVPRIRRITWNGSKTLPARVRNSLGVSVGDPYPGDQELTRIADDVRAALDRDGWRSAHVEAKSTMDESREVALDLRADLGARLLIGSIEFKGDDIAFDEKELREASGLKIGQPMQAGAVLEARRKLLAFHRKLGFYEARIQEPLTPADHDRPGFGRVMFLNFSSGDQVKVEFVKKAISWSDRKTHPMAPWDFRDSRLMALLELENEGQFSEGFGDEASTKIAELYRRKGYLDARVKPAYTEESSKRLKSFVFNIEPGRRFKLVDVKITETDAETAEIRPAELKKEFLSQSTSLAAGYYVSEDVDAAVVYLDNYLRSEGYADARVENHEAMIDRGTHQVRLEIGVDPGRRRRVGAIHFEGNAQAPTDKLASIVAEAPISIAEGNALNIVYLDRADRAIESYYATIGFPYARVAHDAKPSEKKGNVDIVFSVDESFQAYVGRIIVKGNRFTRRNVIDRQIPFKTGQSFDPGALTAGSEALQKLGIFSQVSVVAFGEDEPERVRDVLVAVTEAPRTVFEPSVGASNQDGPRVQLRAQRYNLFGTAKSVTLRLQANWLWAGLPKKPDDFTTLPNAGFDVNEVEGRVLLTYSQPTTFGQPVTTSITSSLFEKFATRTWGYTGNRLLVASDRSIHITDIKPLRDGTFTIGARYQLFLRDIRYDATRTGREVDVALEKQDLSFPSQQMYYWPLKWKIGTGSVVMLLDKRDDRFNPTEGFSANISGALASPAFFSDVSFGKVTTGVTLFKRVPLKFRLVAAARGGYARPFGSTTGIPIDERFHLGGTGSVRGFREDSIGPRFSLVGGDISTGGDVSGLYNLELRHPIVSSVDWVVFHDAGYTKILKTGDVNAVRRQSAGGFDIEHPTPLFRGPLENPSIVSTSVGVGVRAHTPVGPLKFDVGIDTRNLDKLSAIEAWQTDLVYHFTIGDF